jgi:hypothetical protein
VEYMGNFENAKVKVAQGWLQGYTEGKLKIFKGIPYAAPPVGALRFRQPRDPGRWRGGLGRRGGGGSHVAGAGIPALGAAGEGQDQDQYQKQGKDLLHSRFSFSMIILFFVSKNATIIASILRKSSAGVIFYFFFRITKVQRA